MLGFLFEEYKMTDVEKRDLLLKFLHENIVEVSFTKVDGTHRDMLCTLKPDLIPESYIDNTESKKQKSLETICVWDLDKEGWRSFRVDSIIGFNFKGN